jgi:hypothetical protein
LTPEQIAHLDMVQSVVGRMSSHGLAIKSVAVTMAVAVLAFAVQGNGSGSVALLALAGALPIVIFWLLDAYYVRIERAYRCLFDAIRAAEPVDPFTMDFHPFLSRVGGVPRVAVSSWSMALYPALLVLLFVAWAVTK